MSRRSHWKAELSKSNAEGVAEDFDGIGVGMQGAGHRGDEVLVFGEALERLLDDALAGAGDAEHQAQSALLTMDFERVVNLLLLGQQLELTHVEGVLGQSVEGSDHHGCSFRRFSPLATASRRRAAPMALALVVDDDGGVVLAVSVIAELDFFVAQVDGGFIASG